MRELREEIQLLLEPGSYVGEVIKVMGRDKVLVKVRFMCHSILAFPLASWLPVNGSALLRIFLLVPPGQP